jgi:GNAT superfamily N-acetyltransferase
MTADLAIRPADAADYDRWLRLWDSYNEFYGRAGDMALPHDVTLATWSRLHDPSEPMFCLLASWNGELVGLAHYLFHRSTTSIPMVCYLQDLFTSEHARGNGVGSALIERVYAQARAAGCSRVYWQTHETNEVARSLYVEVAERSGFIVYRKSL